MEGANSNSVRFHPCAGHREAKAGTPQPPVGQPAAGQLSHRTVQVVVANDPRPAEMVSEGTQAAETQLRARLASALNYVEERKEVLRRMQAEQDLLDKAINCRAARDICLKVGLLAVALGALASQFADSDGVDLNYLWAGLGVAGGLWMLAACSHTRYNRLAREAGHTTFASLTRAWVESGTVITGAQVFVTLAMGEVMRIEEEMQRSGLPLEPAQVPPTQASLVHDPRASSAAPRVSMK